MENAKIVIPEAFQYAFENSKKVHACQEFDPGKALLVIPSDPNSGNPAVCYLPLDAKRLWFMLWCQQNNKVPRIVTECTNIRFDCVNSSKNFFGYAEGRAAVYADDVLLSSYTAGQCFNIDNFPDVDNVAQSVQGLALTKALTNAGFGAIPSSKVEENAPSSVPAGVSMGNLPFTFTPNSGIAGIMPAPPVQQIPASNTAAPAPDATVSAVQSAASTADPKEAAKSYICTMRGRSYGLKLGEILATSPRTIEYIANAPQCNDAKMQEAAKLLLNDALAAMGKAAPKA